VLRVVGLFIVAISIPIFCALLKGDPRSRRFSWLFIGLSPFIISYLHLDVSIISWAYWPGYVKGALISLLDAVAIAVLITLAPTPHKSVILWAYLSYLSATLLSVLFADPWMGSIFFPWQLGRAIIVFVAVARVSAQPNGARYVIGGLSAGIAFQALFSVMERLHGVTQASGTLGHQNLLGLATHFALLSSMAVMLSGDRRWLPKVGVLGGVIAVILTGSRATTGLAAVGIILLVTLSLLRYKTALKMRVVGIGVALFVVGAPIAYLTLQHRFANEPKSNGYDERAAFERAARAMWSDHPMGVGANQYVVIANTRGYSQRAGVLWTSASRGTNVHNTYLLMGAETGYFGLATYLTLLFSGIIIAMRSAWARPRTPDGEISLGAAVTLIVVALHCLYEWVFLDWVIQYLFAITLGITAGISACQKSNKHVLRRSAHVPSAANLHHESQG
jgi:O-antigen ligase